MNARWLDAEMAAAGNEALWRTNPVLCIDRLIAEWKKSDATWFMCGSRLARLIDTLVGHDIVLPAGAADRWANGRPMLALRQTPEPRMIGLAVDAFRTGYVVPLRPARAQDLGNVDARLPFTHPELLGVLSELLEASGVAERWGVPERFAFRFENATGQRACGESMTIAAALAVVDCMTGFCVPLLRAAAALVQLDSGGRLTAVGAMGTKLEAANRECGQLSLIICAPGSEIDGAGAAEVWEVQSLSDLAGRLHAAGLLDPLLDAVGALDKRESARVLQRLQSLDAEHRYREAADLGDRADHCGFAKPVDPVVLTEFARLHARVCRYHGRFSDAVRVGRDAHDRLTALGTIGCDDDEADAAAEYAASLFSGHRFAEVPPLLERWASATFNEPRRFRPLTRVKVWNTLGRTLAVLGRNGWDELFGRSIAMLIQLKDAENADRATYYRVQACLRHGDTIGARRALDDAPGLSERGRGDPWVASLYANLARAESRLWVDATLEERLAAGKKPYPAWAYLQAAARQPPRTALDGIDRLERAISLLHYESGGNKGNVCQLFAAMLELAVAARSADAARWAAAFAKIEEYFSTAPDHRQYYRSAIEALPAVPNVTAVEKLLNLIPYF